MKGTRGTENKRDRTDVTLTAPSPLLFTGVLEYSHFTNSLSQLPFYSKETTRELAFKIKNSPRSQTNLLRYPAYLGQRLK